MQQLISLSQHFYSESVPHISQIAFCYVNEDAGQRIGQERLWDPAILEVSVICIHSLKFPCTCSHVKDGVPFGTVSWHWEGKNTLPMPAQ